MACPAVNYLGEFGVKCKIGGAEIILGTVYVSIKGAFINHVDMAGGRGRVFQMSI